MTYGLPDSMAVGIAKRVVGRRRGNPRYAPVGESVLGKAVESAGSAFWQGLKEGWKEAQSKSPKA